MQHRECRVRVSRAYEIIDAIAPKETGGLEAAGGRDARVISAIAFPGKVAVMPEIHRDCARNTLRGPTVIAEWIRTSFTSRRFYI